MSDSTKPERRYLDVRGAAAFLGLSVYSVRWYVRRCKIPHRKLGARILFDPAELERWFASLPGVTPTEARRGGVTPRPPILRASFEGLVVGVRRLRAWLTRPTFGRTFPRPCEGCGKQVLISSISPAEGWEMGPRTPTPHRCVRNRGFE